MPRRNGATSSGMPINPVEHTRTSSGGAPELLGREGAHLLRDFHVVARGAVRVATVEDDRAGVAAGRSQMLA